MSCRKMTQLISKSMDEPLSFRERFMLRLHTITCGACRRYRSQLESMRNAIQRMTPDQTGEPGQSLPSDSRQRIADALRESS